jgi:hypothetical protein
MMTASSGPLQTFVLIAANDKKELYTDEKETHLGEWFSVVSISVFSACALFGFGVNRRAARLKP